MYACGEKLEFGRGLSTDGDPALWELDDTGAIIDWVELGVPDLRTVRKAAGKSEHVLVLAYDEARSAPWWESLKGIFLRSANSLLYSSTMTKRKLWEVWLHAT